MTDPATRAALFAITSMPGYPLLMDIFEFQILKLEQAVFNTNPANESEVIAAHRVAVGARWAFEEAKKDIARKLASAEGEKVLTQKEQEELYIKSLQ
jgi:hypothetical protein